MHYSIYSIDSRNVTITNNLLQPGGVFIASESPSDLSSYIITPDNSINGKLLHYYKDCNDLDIDGVDVGQLIVANCRNVRIANLQVAQTSVGLEMIFVENVLVTHNNIQNNSFGVMLLHSANVTIASNRILNNRIGIDFLYSKDIKILDNVISWGCQGISVSYFSSSTIVNNSISNNGVGIHATHFNTLSMNDNNFAGNVMDAFDRDNWDREKAPYKIGDYEDAMSRHIVSGSVSPGWLSAGRGR